MTEGEYAIWLGASYGLSRTLPLGIRMAVLAWRRRGMRRRGADFVAPMEAALAERDWFRSDADDPLVGALALEALSLASAVGQRELGLVVRGRSGAGPVTMFESWRNDGLGTIETTVVLESDAASRPEVALVAADGGAVADAAVAGAASGATLAALAGCPPGTRLQVAPGRVVATLPARLTPTLLGDLLRRVMEVDAGLPRMPEPSLDAAARHAAHARSSAGAVR